MHFAALRPAEAIALRQRNCHLPDSGWGLLTLENSRPEVSRRWTDGGDLSESVYGRVWATARKTTLTEAASPLARRPYDLRHYADRWVMRPAVVFPLLGAEELVPLSA
jgi:hypothetical protein